MILPNPFSALTSKIFGGAALVLAFALGWALWSAEMANNRADKAESAHAETKDNYRTAMAQAEQIHRQQKAEYEARYAAQAKEADYEVQIAQRDAADALVAYIARNRVRQSGAGSGASQAAPAPGDSLAGSGESPSGETDLVAVTADDLRICTVNTVRLEAVRDWALGLNPPAN